MCSFFCFCFYVSFSSWVLLVVVFRQFFPPFVGDDSLEFFADCSVDFSVYVCFSATCLLPLCTQCGIQQGKSRSLTFAGRGCIHVCLCVLILTYAIAHSQFFLVL